MTSEDFLITIPLQPCQLLLVKIWLKRYLDKAKIRWGSAEIAGGMLWVHPAEFPNIMAEARPGECTELEFYRIRKLGTKAVFRSLGKRRSKISIGLLDMVNNSLAGLTPIRNQVGESGNYLPDNTEML